MPSPYAPSGPVWASGRVGSVRCGPVRSLVIVLGPPGSGKTSVARRLVADLGAELFRFKEEWQRQATVDRSLRQCIEKSGDPLGWMPEECAIRVVERAFRRLSSSAASATVVVSEGFPGTAVQASTLLRLCGADTSATRWGTTVIELCARYGTAAQRVRDRRVCPVCDTTNPADPREPVERSSTAPDRCAACHGPALRRPSDEPSVFALKYRRFQDNVGAIRAEFARGGVAYHRLDTDMRGPAEVATLIRRHVRGALTTHRL